jgi:hypothetical protein
MAGSKVAERPAAQVPDLIRTPALEITAQDVVLPRIKMGQYMSGAVKEQLVNPGQLYATVGQDDPDPMILGDEITFYVLHVRRGKSFSEPGGELQRYDFDDPDAPAKAWVTFDYTIAVPEFDAGTPFKLLLTKTGMPAARQLNTILLRATVPQYSLAFRLATKKRENAKGEFFVPQIALVEGDPAQIQAVMDLAVTLSSQPNMGSGNDTPDI